MTIQTEPLSLRVPVDMKRKLEKKAASDQRTVTSYLLKLIARDVGK